MNKKQTEVLRGLNTVQANRMIPGTYLVEGREFCYVSNKNNISFFELFDQLFVCSSDSPISGGAITQGCKIILPNGDRKSVV